MSREDEKFTSSSLSLRAEGLIRQPAEKGILPGSHFEAFDLSSAEVQARCYSKDVMGYDDPTTDAFYDRKLANDLKWQAEQASRKGYHKVAKELWDAYHALIEEARLEEEKARNE